EGSEIKLDRTLLENFTAPLTHLVRNSIDHGIESTDLRQTNGKSRQGNIYLRAYHESGQIVIEVEDDGGGIDAERIKKIALDKEIITEEWANSASEEEIIKLIFAPGFSTKEEVSDVSGRGVGMDAVKVALEKLNGDIHIQTKLDEGSCFILTIPNAC
ncbi:MAG: chemotaxis protein CheA, partial [SAR324 cluster bacterium]